MPKINRHGQASILTDGDKFKIKKYLLNKCHRLIFDIAFYTGERWGAILKLLVNDVYSDPVNSVPYDYITFRKSSRKGKQSTRQVPLHPQLKEAIANFQPDINSVWLFPSTVGRFKKLSGDKPISFQSVDEVFRTAIDKAGLSDRGFSTHSTRRTMITNLNNNGIDIKTIQQITGHESLISLQKYIESSPERIKNAISTL
jgi:integrase/recombinase XerD